MKLTGSGARTPHVAPEPTLHLFPGSMGLPNSNASWLPEGCVVF